MKRIGKKNLFFMIALLVLLLALLVTGVTYAVWTSTASATKNIPLPVDDYNPSEKYLVFRGLTSENAFTTDGLAVSYAVVGYDGLVAEVIIPATHNGLPVTRICVDPAQTNKAFAHNPIVTSMVIPYSVTTIATGACQDMSLLRSVTIEAPASGVAADIAIHDLAFANCPLLTTFSSAREIVGEPTSYLLGSAVE